MSELTPIQMHANGAVTFEKLEAPPMIKETVKTGTKTTQSGHVCTDEVVLSRPLKEKRKKSYFTQAPSVQTQQRLRESDLD